METAHPNIRVYLTVFFALTILTVVTVGVSYLHLPVGTAVVVALIIASFKASLVALYFMHLKTERYHIYILLGITFLALVVLFTLPLIDLNRHGDSHGSPAGKQARQHVP